MKITIANLVNSTAPVLSKMMNKELSPVTSFKLVKLVKAVNNEIEVFNGERVKLLEKYGKKNEENGFTLINIVFLYHIILRQFLVIYFLRIKNIYNYFYLFR